MQYLLMIYEAEELWASKSPVEQSLVMRQHQLLNEKLRADGVSYVGHPLMPTATAVSLRVRGGSRQVTDGPFAETREHSWPVFTCLMCQLWSVLSSTPS